MTTTNSFADQSTSPPGFWGHVALILLLVMLGAVAEVIADAVRRIALGQELASLWATAWVPPIAAAVAGLPVALMVAWLTRRRTDRSSKAVLWVGIFLATIGLELKLGPGIHRGAVMLLAAGLATCGAGLGFSGVPRWARAARQAVPLFMAVLLAAGVGSYFLDRVHERRALQLRSAAPAGAPNILLIILDTVRAKSLSLYGYAEPTTPHLTRWANQGVRFERAIAPAPWTYPSHASILTGVLPSKVYTKEGRPLARQYQTLAERLSDAGYVTAAFVANYENLPGAAGFARGFMRYQAGATGLTGFLGRSRVGRALVGSKLWRTFASYRDPMRRDANDINHALLQWIAARPERPFFALLNYNDAHSPYLPSPPFDTAFGLTAPRLTLYPDFMAPWKPGDDWDRQRNAYEGSIAGLDRELHQLLVALQQAGLLDSTLVVVTADHGEQFGEHGLTGHTNSLYGVLLEVPLVVIWPQHVPAGLSAPSPVSLTDIPATVLDLAGISPGAMPGRSLARWWDQSGTRDNTVVPVVSEAEAVPSLPDWMPPHWGPMTSMILGRWHYINGGEGREELFDLDADPDELSNISGEPQYANLVDSLRRVVKGGQY